MYKQQFGYNALGVSIKKYNLDELKTIYDDFVETVKLTDEQKRILDMLINKDSIIKISMEIGASQRTVSYEIKKLKKLYEDYYKVQLFKAIMLVE